MNALILALLVAVQPVKYHKYCVSVSGKTISCSEKDAKTVCDKNGKRQSSCDEYDRTFAEGWAKGKILQDDPITTSLDLRKISRITLTTSACAPATLLAALEEADREFVEDPNERDRPNDPRDWIPPSSNLHLFPEGGGTWIAKDADNRTPAKKLRDQAEAEAKELERKSDAAKRIRAVLAACGKKGDAQSARK